MTKKLTLEEAQEKLDKWFPNRFKLLTYIDYKSKCNFIWLETNDEDTTYFFRLKEVDDKKNGRFPPSLRQQEFDKRKRTITDMELTILERTHGKAKFISFDPITYKVTLQWQDGEVNITDWRHIIDKRKFIYPLSTIQERMQQTSILRYGTPHPVQNITVADKIAKASNNVTIRKHWQTNNDLVCRASYETKVVDYLNTNKIDFQWQPKVFMLSNGKTYRPDLYLVNEDIWVEIKGYFRDDARLKWEEFHAKIQVNSELWDKQYLKNKGIL